MGIGHAAKSVPFGANPTRLGDPIICEFDPTIVPRICQREGALWHRVYIPQEAIQPTEGSASKLLWLTPLSPKVPSPQIWDRFENTSEMMPDVLR